ncbi:MAG: uridine kinase [Pirellulaceae bacterium]|nr:uridine kinase [Pirellulaceae bacterium]
MHRETVIVGIAGGTGSGKSSLVHLLLESQVGGQITVLPHDHYYLNVDQLPAKLRDNHNWDHPDAVDNRLYVKHIDQLVRGESINQPEYCFETHRRKLATESVTCRRILLVEGILVFAIEEIRRRLQWRVFIEANSDERILRRLVRDTQQRGRSLASVVHQYRMTVRPMHDEWIQPSREHADLVIPNTGPDSLYKGAQVLSGFLRSLIA